MTCQQGYTEQPPGATKVCTSTGGAATMQGPEAQCIPAPPPPPNFCSEPNQVPHGSWSSSASSPGQTPDGGYAAGLSTYLHCSPRYAGSFHALTCRADGQWVAQGTCGPSCPADEGQLWTNSYTACTPITCSADALPTVTHGTWSAAPATGFGVQSTASLRCGTGSVSYTHLTLPTKA